MSWGICTGKSIGLFLWPCPTFTLWVFAQLQIQTPWPTESLDSRLADRTYLAHISLEETSSGALARNSFRKCWARSLPGSRQPLWCQSSLCQHCNGPRCALVSSQTHSHFDFMALASLHIWCTVWPCKQPLSSWDSPLLCSRVVFCPPKRHLTRAWSSALALGALTEGLQRRSHFHLARF